MVVNWHLFANLYANQITPLLATMQAMLAGVCAAVQPFALAGVGLWVAIAGIEVGFRKMTIQDFLWHLFLAAMVIGALSLGQYTQYVADFWLQTVPNSLSAALGGNGSPVAGLDNVLDTAVTAASVAYEALPSWSLKIIPLGCGILVYFGVSLISVGFVFGVYMVATIMNVAAVVIGPVFLALAAVPQTRRFAAGWLGALVGGCAAQLISVAIVNMITATEGNQIVQLVGHSTDNNSNTFGMLWGLAQAAVMMALFGIVVKKIPAFALSIAGGTYHGAVSLENMTFGLAGAAARGAAAIPGAAASGVSKASSAVSSWRLNRAIGRSISGGE